ncbi:MAG: hypothetical protein WD696_17305 [Bryobacteraceae bacterium]
MMTRVDLYRFISKQLSWPGIVYFVVKPRWIRYSDFGADSPLIREFTFEDRVLALDKRGDFDDA